MMRYWVSGDWVKKKLRGLIAIGCGMLMVTASAQVPEFQIGIREHLFYPSELIIPAGQKIKLIVINHDETPEEFESYEMNREKVIVGDSQGIVFIGPLKPGIYPFFGEFNLKTAQGKIIVE